MLHEGTMRYFLALGLLAIAGLSAVVAEEKEWWENMLLYQVYPRSFKDSDGDGIGDIAGIHSKLQHFVDSGIDAFWISPIYTSPMVDFGYDISNFTAIDPIYGTMEDFENLVAEAKSLGLKVTLDFVPNHTSDQHVWFNKSVYSIDPYTDYYVWHSGKVLDNGTITVPNNWLSIFDGSAWEWNDVRQAYYYHQFAIAQPDLNFTNPKVIAELNGVLEFWLEKGVDGFRVDSVTCFFEDASFPDEPLSGTTNDSTNYDYLIHIYTKDQLETYDVIQIWREVLDNYTLKSDNVSKIMMIESYANYSVNMKYFEYGAHFPFNFNLITNVDNTSSASDFKAAIDGWMEAMPSGGTPNWVVGNHDRNRVASRYSPELSESIIMMDLLLPGVSVTYYGEEIGMEDTWISWEDTIDTQACNASKEDYETNSRDPERTPFQWDNTTSAGFSTNETTWLPVNDNYLTLNLAAQKIADISYYKFYQTLTALKKQTVIRDGGLNTQVLSENVFAFSRELDGYDPVFVVVNLANATETVSLDVFTSASETLEIYVATTSSGLTAGEKVARSGVDVPALSGIVLKASDDDSSSASILAPTILTFLFMVNLYH